ncbi:putative transcription factor OFP family [Medicago truncatula]|uniref:Transcription repressor n=1 Tax=Medicago truncatula TaxID=3880 RepID=G7JHA1_MEDTR|nr:transcription repressor OFP6 [Medicago truncatula]AES88297.2 ovate transcriptional repressor [Medicago truncatula]RHN60446.1 putative transcription factor OFP family [Medicago truncatula]
MSFNKKRLMRRVFSTNIGSCGCAKKKAIEVHEPIQKTKISISQISKASSNTTLGERKGAGCSVDHSDDFSTTTFSEAETTQNYSPHKHSPLSNTVVVEKDSDNPYHDFKHSMLQMIFEDEIDSEDDLRVLLRCFLHLNDTCYHLVIVKVFNDICHEAFSDDKVCTTTSSAIKPSNIHVYENE